MSFKYIALLVEFWKIWILRCGFNNNEATWITSTAMTWSEQSTWKAPPKPHLNLFPQNPSAKGGWAVHLYVALAQVTNQSLGAEIWLAGPSAKFIMWLVKFEVLCNAGASWSSPERESPRPNLLCISQVTLSHASSIRLSQAPRFPFHKSHYLGVQIYGVRGLCPLALCYKGDSSIIP